MAQLGYDPNQQSTQAVRHGPPPDRYRPVTEDPELAKMAGGSRGAVIVPKATAAGGSSGRSFRKRTMTVHLAPGPNGTSETVEVDLDKLVPDEVNALLAKATSPVDAWRKIAENQQAAAAAANRPSPVERSAMPEIPTLPQQAGAPPSWQVQPPYQPAAWAPAPPTLQPLAPVVSTPQPTSPMFQQPAATPTPARDPLLEQLATQMSQMSEAVGYLLRKSQEPVAASSPAPAPTVQPVEPPKPPSPPTKAATAAEWESNPLANVGLEYLGYPEPKEPGFQVIFNWGPAGLQAGYYHGVKVIDSIVALEYDTRYKLGQYVPGVRDEPIDIVIINQADRTQKSLRVTTSGILFRVGCLDICLLVVEDKEAEAVKSADPFHKPLSVQQMISGELPDVLPEADYGKTREYRPSLHA